MTTRHAVAGACAAAMLLLSACGGPRALQWVDEDGYRWAELHVSSSDRAGFRLLDPDETWITFQNTVNEDLVLDNEHVLNGSGVALGDVDGDGLVDIYLARLDGPNVLYRNRGGWRFEDITALAGVALPDQLSTGAVLADVDGDGDLDLLVTSMGGPNALFVNRGDGVFDDRTAESGLASGFYGTTMALADVDGDGDLDLYVANNKLRTVRDIYAPADLSFDRVIQEVDDRRTIAPEFREHYGLVQQGEMLMRFEFAEPDKFYLNDGTGVFEDVPFTSGRFLDSEGNPLSEAPRDWGLTARFQDIDGDGDPDLYICNDFESPDHAWLNDGTGRFRMMPLEPLPTTSNANMAIDFADIDRDGDVDFFQLDMLDRNTSKQKTQMPASVPELPMTGVAADRQQLPRNTLYVNRGDATFAEIGNLAGIVASGWSWSVLFLDVDLDGYEDVLIGTGHERDFLDVDTRQRIQELGTSDDWREMRFLYPQLYLPNVAFRNNGDLTFEEVGDEWGFATRADVSQGMATADLDNDGDLDVVSNRLSFPAAVYRNESGRPRVSVRLRGDTPNTRGIGATIHLLGGATAQQSREVVSGGIYVSSSDPHYSFAAGDAAVMRLAVQWRSGRWSVVDSVEPNRIYEVNEAGAVAASEIPRSTIGAVAVGTTPTSTMFTDVSAQLGHTHRDAPYDDFARQPLVPYQLSHLGPGAAWLDLDSDGDDDLVLGTGRGGTLAAYRNTNGRLTPMQLSLPEAAHDLTSLVSLPDGAGRPILLVGQMSYEAADPTSATQVPGVVAVDLETGRMRPAIPGSPSSTGPLALADYDGDGDLDLFVGGRVLPARYPAPATSRLFHNTGDGSFTLDSVASAPFADVGLVSSATFADLDQDGDPELLLAREWGTLMLWQNDGGRFTDVSAAWGLSGMSSLWLGITTGDLTTDGRLDVVATSWGRNTRYQPTPERPLVAYAADFDRNGSYEIVTAQFDPRLQSEVPLRGLARLAPALPYVGRRVPSFAAYATASLEELLGPPLASATRHEVTTLAHQLFVNQGDHFTARPLPPEAQFAPSVSPAIADYNGDGHDDLLLTQNLFPTDEETQRYQEGRGLLLEGDGTGQLVPVPGQASGLMVYGDQRAAALADYDADGRVDVVLTQNSGPTTLWHNTAATPGLRVRLHGPARNPTGVGAVVQLGYADGRRGPARPVTAGTGHWSQHSPVLVLGRDGTPATLHVRWPDGSETETPVPSDALEVIVAASARERR